MMVMEEWYQNLRMFQKYQNLELSEFGNNIRKKWKCILSIKSKREKIHPLLRAGGTLLTYN